MLGLLLDQSVKSRGGSVTLASLVSYTKAALRTFLPFCADYASVLARELLPEDINQDLIQRFLAHLAGAGREPTGQKSAYSHVKTVLVEMGRRGVIARDIFPKNPFPKINRKYKGERPLSKHERTKVLQALKPELRRILAATGPIGPHDLSLCLLAIAARTGLNPSPLFELPADCLQPHPIKADRQLLVSYKRRGSNTHIQTLRKSADVEVLATAMPDVAALVDLLANRNAGQRVKSAHPFSLCVYEGAQQFRGQFLLLSRGRFFLAIRDFCEEHRLHGDDGKALRLNLSRLRKTFENRVWELSGQDPFVTARMSGHDIKVSNDYYLEAPPEAESDFRLMGEIRTGELRGRRGTPETNTPVARCKDTLAGELAPKNGTHCQKFLACFRCRSFVVTGDDLYRLFSFYWMLIAERARIGSQRWGALYAHVIRIIDNEIAPRFAADRVREARDRARSDPHPFWRSPDALGFET